MSSQRITVRVPKNLGALLRRRSQAKGLTPSDVVRAALENYLGQEPTGRSAYDLAHEAGLVGCVSGAPNDLSTNPRHLDGFGKQK